MSFSGNLEHLPIVDVIQLLNSTKKTGTLYVRTDGLEYIFALKDGLIVSVSHPDTFSSLMRVIRDKKNIDDSFVNNLIEKKGSLGKPLIAYLVEQNILTPESALSLLQSFVELTVVDILTWQSGNFQLVVDKMDVDDNFQYLADLLKGSFYISTQNTLMESLRIFDEMRRDNLLDKGIFDHQIRAKEEPEGEITISEDILGLDNIDKIERKIPSVFKCVDAQDLSEPHRKKVFIAFPDATKADEEKIVNFLTRYSQRMQREDISVAIILLTKDEFMSYVINIMAKSMGVFVFTTDSVDNISIIIKQSLSKQLIPVVITDYLSENIFNGEKNNNLKKGIRNKFPVVKFIQLVDWENKEIVLNLLKEGVLSVFPKPVHNSQNIEKVILFYESIENYIKNLGTYSDNSEIRNFKNLTNQIGNATKISEIINLSLKFISDYFERSAILVAHKDGYYLENVIGITIQDLPKRVVLSSGLYDLVNSGELIYRKLDRENSEPFFSLFGKPEDEEIFLIPIKGAGKLLAFLYGDTQKKVYFREIFEILRDFLNSSVELMLYRKMFEKSKKTE
ncbi:MAG: DUF4388 domain-containing protein [Proteobacteria bacterium]|nr:DUF4388 domain-containing protein [Pseudomonadota bacterium]